ncbi:hypothetical protein [Pseudobutyrivibrio xylanivorans]|uniref:Calcium:proton exchanger n=1 Tax=Pseudobutyrivibrio xylanivorans DSM 14809 TaxID=1123012 RepID=A0A1M6E0R8_PSEXY|nr:hypothetical protein [Pseudobutyrivibrio xylanivorans]SHI79097.1 hypothetical protein SAMN02745725_01115 [Pseudobutyrivibrio xylanivorans DSM 14809]
MGRVRPHRRNSYGNQLKALPMEAMYAAGVSIFSLVIYGAIMGVSVYMAGETPKFVGGIGMLGCFLALAAFLYNVAQMKTKTELKYRLICLAVSTLAMAIWVGTFILGMVN